MNLSCIGCLQVQVKWRSGQKNHNDNRSRIKKCCGLPFSPGHLDLLALIRAEFPIMKKSMSADWGRVNNAISDLSQNLKTSNTRLSDCKSITGDNIKRIEEIEVNVVELKGQDHSEQVQGHSSDMPGEFENRIKRENNWSLFGLPESTSVLATHSDSPQAQNEWTVLSC